MNASAVSHDGTSLQLLRRGEEATVEVGGTVFLLPGLYPLRLQTSAPPLMYEQERTQKTNAAAAPPASGDVDAAKAVAPTDWPRGVSVDTDKSLAKSGPVRNPASALLSRSAATSAAASVDVDWDAAQAAWAALEQDLDDEGETDSTTDGRRGRRAATAATDVAYSSSAKGKLPSSSTSLSTDLQQNKRKRQAPSVHLAPTNKRTRADRSDDDHSDVSSESSVSDSDSDWDAGRDADDEYQHASSPGHAVENNRNRRSSRNNSSSARCQRRASPPATTAAASSSNANAATCRAVWEWDGGRSGWKPYSARDNELVEAAYQSWWEQSLDDDDHESDADGTIELDTGYIVVFCKGTRGGTGMRQVKADDPTRSRRVQRRVVP